MSEYQHPLPLEPSSTQAPQQVEIEKSEPIDWGVIKRFAPALIIAFAAVAYIAFVLIPMLTGVHHNSYGFASNLQFSMLALCLLAGLYLTLIERYYLFSAWILFIYLAVLGWF